MKSDLSKEVQKLNAKLTIFQFNKPSLVKYHNVPMKVLEKQQNYLFPTFIDDEFSTKVHELSQSSVFTPVMQVSLRN